MRTATRRHRRAHVRHKRRSRSGEGYRLWRVQDSRDQRLGLLVTYGETPRAVAFVSGVDGAALRRAASIRTRPWRAGQLAGTIDLRNRRVIELPWLLVNALLLPIDSRGRQITTSATFAGGMFMKLTGKPIGFIAMTRAGVVDLQKERRIRCDSRPMPSSKSGSKRAA